MILIGRGLDQEVLICEERKREARAGSGSEVSKRERGAPRSGAVRARPCAVLRVQVRKYQGPGSAEDLKRERGKAAGRPMEGRGGGTGKRGSDRIQAPKGFR